MTNSSQTDEPDTRRFSLAQLMLCVVMIALFLGIMRQALPHDFYGFYVALIGAMAGVIVLLAALGQVRLVRMLAILAVLGVVIGYFFRPVGPIRQRPPCNQHLQDIGAAMVAYCNEHDRLPPPFIADAQGKPMHSWRVLILPYLGEQELYDQYRFDEPWDGPNNKKLHNRIVEAYSCPNDHPARSSLLARETSYVVIVGPGTVFPADSRRKISIADVFNGDGASNTILVAEVHSSGIHWMEPRDLDFATMDFQINGKQGASISSKHADGAMVVMVDGAVRYLDDTAPPQNIKRLILIDDEKRAAQR